MRGQVRQKLANEKLTWPVFRARIRSEERARLSLVSAETETILIMTTVTHELVTHTEILGHTLRLLHPEVREGSVSVALEAGTVLRWKMCDLRTK